MKENLKNIFTKDKCKCIMKKKYSPFIVNSKKYLRKKGLLMEETKVILNKIQNAKELNLKDKVIIKLFPKTFIKVYGIAGRRVFNDIYKL